MNADDLADLEEQRTFLVRSLDDLDRELAAGDIDVVDAATLREDYTHRLADVQRAIEGGRVAIAGHAAPRHSAGRRAVAVLVVAALALGAGLTVAQMSGSRDPGDPLTGTITDRGFDDLLAEAAELAQEGRFADALRNYDEVLDDDADNVEALAEKGLLLASLSQATERPQLLVEGERLVRAAIGVRASNPRPHFYLGLILRLKGDEPAAARSFDAALGLDPPAALRARIEQFREAAGAAADGGGGK